MFGNVHSTFIIIWYDVLKLYGVEFCGNKYEGDSKITISFDFFDFLSRTWQLKHVKIKIPSKLHWWQIGKIFENSLKNSNF